MSTPLTAFWTSLVMGVIATSGDYLTSSGRKYVTNEVASICREDWDTEFEPTVQDLGYGERSTKMTQLMRNYFNAAEFNAAKAKLISRIESKADFTSVAVNTIGGEKDARGQGHCLRAITVTYIHKSDRGKPEIYITIFYRQTEVIKKFAADIIFLKEKVLPALIPEEYWEYVQDITFNFSNIFFSALFLPILYPYVPPEEIWRYVDGFHRLGTPQERSFRRACIRYIFWPLVEPNADKYHFRSRQVMHNLALRYMQEGVVNRETLEKIYMDLKDNM